MKEYMSKEEYEKCKKVKEIFDTLLENKSGYNEFCIADAYPFGFLVMEWFYPEEGFDSNSYFNNASELFDYSLSVWESGYLFGLKEKYSDCDMSDSQTYDKMSEEEKEAMECIRHEFLMRYENGVVCWDQE